MITSIATATKKKSELLDYLKSELDEGRYIHPGSEGTFHIARDKGFGFSSSLDPADSADTGEYLVTTSDSTARSLASLTEDDVTVHFDVPEEDWQATLDAEMGAAEPREPVLQWYEVDGNGKRYHSGIFYAIT